MKSTKRRVVHSPSNAAVLGEAAEFLRGLGDAEAVVLAHTRTAADEFVRSTCDNGIAGVHRMTLAHLAASLAARPAAERKLAPVSSLGVEALAARVAHALLKREKLSYFAPVAGMSGFARALASTLTELRLESVAPQNLAAAGAPGSDLAQLLSLYEAELAERSLADLAILFELAVEIAGNGKHRLLGLPLLLLNVATDSASHRRFLRAIVERSPAVLATAVSGDERGIRALEEILGAQAERIEEAHTDSLCYRMRANLFSVQATPAQKLREDLEFFSAPGEGLESIEIARRIQRLAQAGTAFDRIAVLLRNPERYRPLVEEALRRAGVPGYFTRGSARPDPAGRAFLALLACAGEGCSATRFAEYLSLGQVPAVDSAGAPQRSPVDWVAAQEEVLVRPDGAPPDEGSEEQEPDDEHSAVVGGTLRAPSGWEKLIVDASVIGGRDRWARRLEGLEAEFRLKLNDPETGASEREHFERKIEQLGNLQRFALPLIDALGSLPVKALWGEWLERLTDLARIALRRPESVLSILSELHPMSDVGPVDLDEVAGVLGDRLRFLRRDPPARRYGRVFISTIEEARGMSFDVVFLPGLAEGLFPRKSLEDPLLLDEYRTKQNGGLAVQNDRVARERLLLRTAAAAARTRFVVSYPRMDTAQARPRVPSFYALEVVRAAEGKLPELRGFEKRAEEAAPARLGWPAPKTPHEAVDDAEYDLAALDAALKLPRKKARGSARFLIEVNPHLARSLRARWSRWHKSWSSSDGIVDPDAATIDVLKQYRLAERSYSPSSLQHYAACPYRFVLYAIHKLRPREERSALEELDPRTRGAMFHEVQLELFRELEAAGLLPPDLERLPKILELADAALDRVATRYEEQLAPAIPRVWKSEVEDIRTDLRGWLRHLAQAAQDWEPIRFEYSFGLGLERGRDPRSSGSEAILPNGARLHGIMDLVERHRTRGVLRVTDHKTGKPPEPPPAWVGGGAVLQPMLYGLAAEQLLNEPVLSGRLFYCTQRGNYSEIEIPLTRESRERGRIVLETIDRAIEEGFLPAAPHKDACELCDYRLVCGPYEESRVQRKQRDRLEALFDVRRMP